jgi:hypothetical protein
LKGEDKILYQISGEKNRILEGTLGYEVPVRLSCNAQGTEKRNVFSQSLSVTCFHGMGIGKLLSAATV